MKKTLSCKHLRVSFQKMKDIESETDFFFSEKRALAIILRLRFVQLKAGDQSHSAQEVVFKTDQALLRVRVTIDQSHKKLVAYRKALKRKEKWNYCNIYSFLFVFLYSFKNFDKKN